MKRLSLILVLAVLPLVACDGGGTGPRVEASWTFNSRGLDVQFENTTTGASFYQWNFGDLSAPSNEENPLHRYFAADTYRVRLTACPSRDFEDSNCDIAPGLVTVTELDSSSGASEASYRQGGDSILGWLLGV